jgi:hypothetical protein
VKAPTYLFEVVTFYISGCWMVSHLFNFDALNNCKSGLCVKFLKWKSTECLRSLKTL